MLEILVVLLVLAASIEAATEIISKRVAEPILIFFFKDRAEKAVKAFAPLLAFGLGLAAAFIGNLDAFAEYGVFSDLPQFGYFLTGVALGGGSNYIHNLFRPKEKPPA